MVLDQGQRKGINGPGGNGRHCAHGEVAGIHAETNRRRAACSTEAKEGEKAPRARVENRCSNSAASPVSSKTAASGSAR